MKKHLLALSFSAFFLASCGTNDSSTDQTMDSIGSTSTPVFEITNPNVKLYTNLEYGESTKNVFDIFIPDSETPTPLALLIHGGAFIFGQKEDFYTRSESVTIINDLLSQNIAVASINYSLIQEMQGGVSHSLKDSKKALQYIRHRATDFNIEKENIVLVGTSAGAGSALWVGLSDDRLNLESSNLIDHESTRVKGLVLVETQASYDLFNWQDEIFLEYKDQGLPQDSILAIVGTPSLYLYAGVRSQAEFESKHTPAYQDTLNMLNLISSDDPEIYVSNSDVKYEVPTSLSELYHHPLHAKAIMDRANQENLKGVFEIPEMKINTTRGESISEFIIRKLKSEL